MSDPQDNSIPVLHEILVPGRAPHTRDASDNTAAPTAQPVPGSAGQTAAAPERVTRQQPGSAPPPARADESALAAEPVLAPQPVPTPEELASPKPVLAPEPPSESKPAGTPAPQAAQRAMPSSAVASGTELYPPHVADHTHAKNRPRPHHGVHARHGHDEIHEELEVSPGVFDRGEPGVPLEAGATVPPDLGHETEHHAADEVSDGATREGVALTPHLDADVIAARLRGRFAGFLASDARSLIEARCRDALQQHMSLLVGQITTEVVRTLEAEMTAWVREAVADEIARRSGRE